MIIKPHFNIYCQFISDEKGYGVFTNDFIPKESIVETAYCIPMNGGVNWIDYKYSGKGSNLYIPTGFSVIYNHSDTPNIRWKIIGEKLIEFISIRDINIGEELCHSYGDIWWKSRIRTKKKII